MGDVEPRDAVDLIFYFGARGDKNPYSKGVPRRTQALIDNGLLLHASRSHPFPDEIERVGGSDDRSRFGGRSQEPIVGVRRPRNG